MSKRPDDVEQVLTMLRQLLATIKDHNIPEDEADKIVGRLLGKIDKLMESMDEDLSNSTLIAKDDHIKNKIQIEGPTLKPVKSKSTGRYKPKAQPK